MNISTIQNVVLDPKRTELTGSLYVLKQLTGEQSFEKQILELLRNNPQQIAQEQIKSTGHIDVRV